MSDIDVSIQWPSEPTPQPTTQPVNTPATPPAKSSGGCIRPLFLIAIGASLAFLALRGCSLPDIVPDPSPDIVIADDGLHVLFAKAGDLTADQGQVASSAKVIKWCKDNDAKYRSIEIDADTETMEPVWGRMIALAVETKGETSMLITADKDRRPKFKATKLPASVDSAIEFLKGN